MKVLLCEDVAALGWLGDVVEVNDGYARNYLLPQRLAMIPTEANLRALADEKASRVEHRKLSRERLEKVAEAVDGAEAVLASKANEQGVLFGSVGEREIAANLAAQGFEVSESQVAMGGHIKEVGTHNVKLRFDKDLMATVSVVVVAEGGQVEGTERPEEGAEAEKAAGEQTEDTGESEQGGEEKGKK
jgi:large subunit ribosomal protein L9